MSARCFTGAFVCACVQRIVSSIVDRIRPFVTADQIPAAERDVTLEWRQLRKLLDQTALDNGARGPKSELTADQEPPEPAKIGTRKTAV